MNALRYLAIVLVALCTGPVIAQTLALPSNLVDSRSAEGGKLLIESEANRAYFPLAANFVTQKNQAFCGVASMTMVLNAMPGAKPAVPEFEPYHTYTQDNVLDDSTDTVIARETILKMGMTLDQIGAVLALRSVKAEVRHVSDTTMDTFRAEARAALSTADHYVIVNYLRKAMGQEKGGHISPLAAYDEQAARFLILDLARY
ncbi:phytochelatin synthase family protein, partial [Nostoc sp. NIES-2111]